MARVTSLLEIIEIKNGQRTILERFDRRIEAPNWTPDGSALIYNAEGRMYRFDLVSHESQEIATGFATRCNNDHVLSPDGTHLAISHHSAEDGQSRVYVVPVVGGEPRLVTPIGPSYLHGWSPDGTTLSYCAERSGQYDIYTMAVIGGPEHRLTDTPGLDDGPEYAPDGQHLWFNSVRSGLMQIWRMGADGSDPTQMTFGEANHWFPHVSPNGSSVVFISYQTDVPADQHPADKPVRLELMPVEGGAPELMTECFGGQGTLNVNSWAPDSQRLAFVSYHVE
jgi:TolB protein